MQALWAEPHVTFKGKWHTIEDAGINPRPASGKVPLWFGGHAEATFRRTAKYGDGFMPLAYPPDDTALAAFDKLRSLVRAEGRDPADVGIEVWVSPGAGGEADWRKEMAFWKRAGVTHATAHTTFPGGHHKRIAGNTPADHPGGDHPVPRGGGGSAVGLRPTDWLRGGQHPSFGRAQRRTTPLPDERSRLVRQRMRASSRHGACARPRVASYTRAPGESGIPVR